MTGEASEKRGARRARPSAEDSSVTVLLEHGRWRNAGWAGFGLVLGVLLLWMLDVVGQGVGVALVVLGGFNAWRFGRTLAHPAGEIRVTDREIRLPRGLCRSGHIDLAPDAVRHAFFLRRAVPFGQTGPVLVIQSDEATYAFPRDWFASDADQHRVAHALNRRLGRLP